MIPRPPFTGPHRLPTNSSRVFFSASSLEIPCLRSYFFDRLQQILLDGFLVLRRAASATGGDEKCGEYERHDCEDAFHRFARDVT
jgi:hypothetical protein